MTDSLEHLETCPTCGVSIDTSAFEPLSRVSCPECGGSMVVGQYLAHYELIEAVGRGGMGVVYKARDTSLDRFVALKVLRKDHSQHAEFIAQLETEAAITASINHPHVVRVFTTGTDAGRFYIAMELVDKGTLDDLIGLQGQVAEAQVLEIAIQIAQGLRAAYQHGLIHRDVKPGNILFSDAHTAKIVDFGLAMLEAAAQGGGEVWGTPYYVAPEKLDRKPEDFRSDMYSLGATLFHALAGRPPYEAEDASMVALKHLKSQAVSLQAFAPHISSSTAYVINRTLLKDPDQRYQSYDEFIEHLEYAKSELEKKGSQPQAKQRVVLETEADRKVMSYVTFGMLGFAAILGLGGWWYYQHKNKVAETQTRPAGEATPAPQVIVGAGDTREMAIYQNARNTLVEGKAPEAAKVFEKLGTDRKTPSPLAEWSLIHWGLSELIAGREEESRAAFAKILARRQTDDAFKKDDLGTMIRDLADLAKNNSPAPASATDKFSQSKPGAIAFLILGLKNWLAGDYDTGGSMLRQYDRSDFQTEYSWMGAYRKLIADQLSDFSEYRGIVETAKIAKTKEDEDRALAAIASARESLHTKGKLVEKLDALAQELKSRGDSRGKDYTKKREADQGALAKVRTEVVDACKGWKFGEAREAAAKLSITTDEVRRRQMGMLLQLDLLQRWKAATLAELNANAAKALLKKRDGSEVKNLVKATEDGVEAKGVPLVKWQDIAPESVIAATANLVKPDLAPDILAERRFLLGTFASMVGIKGADQLLLEAAKANPPYASDLPLVSPLFRAGGDNVAKKGTATASGFVKTDQFDETPGKALDGNPKTKWCAKESGPKWLAVDIGSPMTICRWVVHHASSGGESADMNTVDFALESSDDGKDWKTVDKVQGNKSDVTARSVAPFTAKQVRISISKPNARNNDPTARIVDFAVQSPSKTQNDPDPIKNFFISDGFNPAPLFTSVNIGKVDQRGNVHLSDRNGEFSVRVSGDDIWKQADSFKFTNQKLNGDGEIVARVSSIENVHEWVKAGIMFRESLAPESPNVLFALTPAPKITLQTRPSAGAETTSLQGLATRGAPLWLKLVREGSKFTSFTSEDGLQWKEFKTTTLQMPPEVYVGLALTSHVNATETLSKFDFVRITAKKEQNAPANAPAPRS